MTELINSLKTFAYSGSTERKNSSGQLIRTIPLLNLSGRADSCTDSGFNQWRDAMRMIARLPSGIPLEFRLRLWENLSDRYMQDNGIVWSRVIAKCRVANSRDNELADQIEKDLHRTGCTGFSGAKQAMLKKVLVSYARWNPAVGYCQGFNMIGAMLLQMTGGNETLTLKVFIFLIEGVLPQGYFSQGLRGLAVDMAVFREILKLRKPTLNAHLSRLQQGEDNPPLTDVFTMHWFLTLFIHCLPTNSVLRIWDLVLLEGSEVLLRTALVLWAAIETRILGVSSADEFYSVMGVVTREMLEFGLMDPNSLVKCIVSVGPFPFPGLQDLRVKHRALVAQDTPHKSFFLAKRELDNLKRHYAAIRHRQRATTIILKGLEASTRRAAGQRSASLFVATTKKQVVSPKPKIRRASFGKSLTDMNTNATKGIIPANNNNNNTNRISLANSSQQVNNLKNFSNNSMAPNGNSLKVTNKSQVTMTWDKAAKKPKNFRRRRTASASSHTTSSSSSTELCDSSESSSDSEGVWTDSDSRWKKKPKVVKDSSPTAPGTTKELVTKDSNGIEENGTQGTTPQINILSDKSPSPPRSPMIRMKSAEELILDEIAAVEVDPETKCIDTNDSQHFLDEMSRLGKSDSFYESLSQRICELQFQNLHILTTCNTVIEPTKMIVPFEVSPLPSPISPMPQRPTFNESLDNSKLTLSPNPICISNNIMNRSPCPSPRLLSPRGSISSNAESPLPKSPMSPSPDFSRFRKLSKSSISSTEIPEILIEDKENIPSQNGVEVDSTKDENVEYCPEKKTDTAVIILKSDKEDTENKENVDISADIIGEKKDEMTKGKTADTENKNKLISGDEGKLEIMDQDYVILQESFTIALETLTECSRQSANMKLSQLPLTSAVRKASGEAANSSNLCKIPLDFSLDCVNSSKVVQLPPSCKENHIVSEVTPIFSQNASSGTSSIAGDAFTFDDVDSVEPGNAGKAIPPTFLDLPLPSPTTLKTAACPCQCQTTEDINAVIRENIAILQRLKLKPAYDDGDEDKYEDDDMDDFEDDSSDFDLGFSQSPSACAENDSSDQDSGIPISSSQGDRNLTPKRMFLNKIPPHHQVSQLSLDDSEGVGVSISNATTSASASPNLTRRHSSSSSKPRTKLKSSSKAPQQGKSNKPKKVFNPFPTARKSRVRTSSKFGLYS